MNSNFFEEFLENFGNINKAAEEMISSKIVSPIGSYFIQTGPNPFPKLFDYKFITIVAVQGKNGKEFEPIGVETYETKEEAETGRYNWQRVIMDTPPPPLLLKDCVTGKVIYITP